MKRIATIAIVGIVVIGLGYLVSQQGSTLEVNNVATINKTVEVTPEWATDEDAVKAAQDVIRKKELQAELETLEVDFASSTATFVALEAAYEAKKTELEKELGTY